MDLDFERRLRAFDYEAGWATFHRWLMFVAGRLEAGAGLTLGRVVRACRFGRVRIDYEGGREHYRAWMQAAFGYDDTLVGSHAGISDTSQMLHVYPQGVRKDQIMPWGGPKDSGVTGDPTRATAEIGRMGIEFKVNAGISQYRLLKNPPQPRGGRPGPGR